jgi:methylmalonyl-CoA mutase
LKDLNFEDELDFNEFPPVSTEKWEEIIQKDLKGKNYKDVLRWDTGEGFNALPFYRSEDLKPLEHSTHPLTSSGNWNVLEIIEAASPEEANKQCLHALENGAGGLDLRLKSNSLSSKSDLETLFKDIQIEIISIVFGLSISTPKVAGWFREIISDRKLDHDSLDLHFSADLFSQCLVNGKLPDREDLKPYLSSLTQASISLVIDTSAYTNAGANLVQQLAFALAAGNEYLGMDQELADKLSFRFSTGTRYFPEIGKYRAFRLLWDQVLNEYGVSEHQVEILTETALWNKTQNDAYNNMLRTTTEAMSAAIGGCQSMSVHRFDDHFNEPTPFASRIARNTQLILQEEAYLSRVSDPAAGSYYIEVITEELCNQAWGLFQKIEQKGGFHESLRSGYIHDLMMEARQAKIRSYRQETEVLVGVNKYQPDETINDLTDKQIFTDVSDELPFKNTTDIPAIEPLHLEAELQKGDA